MIENPLLNRIWLSWAENPGRGRGKMPEDMISELDHIQAAQTSRSPETTHNNSIRLRPREASEVSL